MESLFTGAGLTALAQVLLADLVLAGDNAVVIGVAAAGLPAEQRRRVVILGIVIATVLRIGFSAIALDLLEVIGLTLAGGILLLWVAWKMWREIRHDRGHQSPGDAAAGEGAPAADGATPKESGPPGFRRALRNIVLADVSMSLDNVLAVAGAAGGNVWVLGIGLAVSVALTGFASTLIARWLGRYRWIAYAGLAMVAFIAVKMIWRGGHDVLAALDWI